MSKQKVLVCTKGKTCRKQGAKKVFCALEKEIACQGLAELIRLRKSDCLGHCGSGPTIKIKGERVWFEGVTPAGCEQVVGSILCRLPVR